MPSPEFQGIEIDEGPLGQPEPPASPRNHWPPTNPLDPDFLGRLTGHGPPSGWIYHGSINLHQCVDLQWQASYFWRGSTALLPTAATSWMDVDANCLSTQYTGARSQSTVAINCLGLATYSDSDSRTGSAVGVTRSLAHRDATDLACQPGSTLHYTMEARMTRPNGTYHYYCVKATGLLGGTISQLSANSNPC